MPGLDIEAEGMLPKLKNILTDKSQNVTKKKNQEGKQLKKQKTIVSIKYNRIEYYNNSEIE